MKLGDDPDGAGRAARAAEAAARHAYGRLLSWLAWQWRDIAAAEDALADALLAALLSWPSDGVPDRPEAWLLTAARRNLLKVARHRRVTEDPTVTVLLCDDNSAAAEPPAVPDARLRLMFVCAHPAIDAPLRSLLMLQTVLGIDAARIARACLVAPEAMTKRLVRAKAKIKATGLRFEEPEARELPQRLAAVLEAIYGACTLDWNEGALAAPEESLADEALHLARLAASLLPDEPEALGLLALLELNASRAAARTDCPGSTRATARTRYQLMGSVVDRARPRHTCRRRQGCDSQARSSSKQRSSSRTRPAIAPATYLGPTSVRSTKGWSHCTRRSVRTLATRWPWPMQPTTRSPGWRCFGRLTRSVAKRTKRGGRRRPICSNAPGRATRR